MTLHAPLPKHTYKKPVSISKMHQFLGGFSIDHFNPSFPKTKKKATNFSNKNTASEAPEHVARHPQLLWSVAFAPEGHQVAACHGAVGQSPAAPFLWPTFFRKFLFGVGWLVVFI